ncbi:glycosyltransferase involved in cell wall biosynthesis [Salinibacter ruber]|uniref:glycosyltransferase n=1 Tax=Salinibacter ruber TaxID=146919 RepID=UPI00216A0F32|nr:glycosyltransferase [Salinibacter ruber]MCS4155843.1 glycosyltransferase involved in cell wall biosynthesis [Salinibacter ruber]
MNVTAIEIAGKSATYDWEKVDGSGHFRRKTLFPDTDSSTVGRRDLQVEMSSTLDEISPEAVATSGWAYPRALAALWWCYDRGVPAIVMSESSERDFQRSWWREWGKMQVVRHFGAGLVGGTPHQTYLRELGMREDRIFKGYDAVDNDHFATGARSAQNNAQATRRKYSLPHRYFLASARFVPKKNLRRLIEAFARYRAHAPSGREWELVLLGDGPNRNAVEEVIDTEGVRESVHLPGFKQYDVLPVFYGLAGAFVHASTREQWGLVVNEAMACGLPVLVSDRCGCALDLVDEGGNGFTFDPYDPSALARLMVRVAHGDVDRERMGAVSQDIIAEWGPERFATGLRKATEAALHAGPPSFSLSDRLLTRGLMYR